MNKFELYNDDNKIYRDKYDQMHKILVENYNKINGKDNSNIDMYNSWVNGILNTKGYNILLCLREDILVGFICFMYLDKGIMLSEIQIKKEYQGKYHILKDMFKELINKIEKDKTIYGTISNKNIKSQEIFTHIGFNKEDGILYSISYNDLIKWINKN